ncbi:hypothetical protein LIER_33714 [Lithospermum erythrorhizon]|uniref:Uncharacterized protein n=1 Tax=Lithospermum erythrorhizon TaxID=34254 RepID=A0AAV3RXF8_LITER
MSISLKSSLFIVSLLLFSSAIIEARNAMVRPIKIAREAFEAQFQKELRGKKYGHADRVSPGGPDPHHHFIQT